MKLKKCLLLFMLAFCVILALTACGGDPNANEGKSECERLGHQYSSMGLEGKKDPTCTEDGYEKECCWVCGDIKTTVIPALGHTEVVEEAVEATCEEDGKTEKKYCSVCEAVILESEVIPGGHILGDQAEGYGYAPNVTSDGRHFEGRVSFRCTKCEKVQNYPLPVLTDSAYTVERIGESEKYTITIEGKTVEFVKPLFILEKVERYNDAYYKILGYRGDSTSLVIPSELYDPTFNLTLPVKVIAENLFRNSTTLKSITIPASVKEIPNSAFENCKALTTVTLLDGVESIGSMAFNGCTALKTVTLPSSVTSIGAHAFSFCAALTEINIPEGVTIINTRTFSDCTSLKSITIPKAVQSIGNTAFANCSALENVTFAADSELYMIYESAFMNCTSLKKIVSPAPMLVGALNGCTAIESITVLRIKASGSYSYIDAVGGWFGFNEYDSSDFVPESLKELIILDEYIIDDGMIAGCKWIERVEIRNCREGINSGAFAGCTALKEVVIGTAERLGGGGRFSSVFSYCTNLQKVTLENVKSIELDAFYDQRYVKEITLGGVANVSERAFYNCSSLEKVVFDDELKYISNDSFNSCDKLQKISLPGTMIKIGQSAFESCPMLKEVTAGSVEMIENKAFYNCTMLEKIIVADGLTSISAQAFSGCTALTTVSIPSCIDCVETTAFEGCTELITNEYKNGKYIGNGTDKYLVLIGYTVDELEYGEKFEEFEIKEGTRIVNTDAEFWSSFKLYSIPASVKYIYGPIEYNYGSTDRRDINYGGTVLDWLKINIDGFSYGLLNGGTVTFSDGKTNEDITNIVLDDSFTSIGGKSYQIFNNVVSITIPATVKNYNGDTLLSETLENVYYNGTVEDWCKLIRGYYSPMIYAEHFYMLGDDGEYYEPKVIEIPESITNVGEYFLHFKNLKAIVIHKDVDSIDDRAFNKNYGLCLYFKGTAEQWSSKRYKSWSEKLEVYFYSETAQTFDDYLNNPQNLWHYNANGEAEAYVKFESNVAGKTYVYSTTEVTVTLAYWQLLQQIKEMGMLGEVMDPVQLEMFNSSSTKEEFASKLAAYASSAAAGLSVSFANGQMTFAQNGQPVSVNYVESDGKIYVKILGSWEVMYYVDAENNCIYEYNENRNGDVIYTTTKHIYNSAN